MFAALFLLKADLLNLIAIRLLIGKKAPCELIIPSPGNSVRLKLFADTAVAKAKIFILVITKEFSVLMKIINFAFLIKGWDETHQRHLL